MMPDIITPTNAIVGKSPRSWVAVASAEHVRIGRAAGFMQVCHGKAAPLRRINPGDRVVYYSPTTVFRGKDKLQSFTAIGLVRDAAPYQTEMAPGFCPYRRDVDWRQGREIPIQPLLGLLDFTRSNRNWGYQLRFGLFEISLGDMDSIAQAMAADLA
jgi:hypothetical protein